MFLKKHEVHMESNPEFSSFIFKSQLRLLQTALAPWPRRTAPLLEINCGDGHFTPFFWQWGFDVVATESNQLYLRKARKNTPATIQISAADSDDLPFENDTFDWAILHLDREIKRNINDYIQEALRICQRGLMVTFWNRLSIPLVIERFLHHKQDFPFIAHSWIEIWRQAHYLDAGELTWLSTFSGPVSTWKESSHFAGINFWLKNIPVGAWCILRIDLDSIHSVTPLSLPIENTTQAPEPALEYTKNRLNNATFRRVNI